MQKMNQKRMWITRCYPAFTALLLLVATGGCLSGILFQPPMFYVKELGEIDFRSRGATLSTEFSYPYGFVAGVCILTTNSIPKDSPLVWSISIENEENIKVFNKTIRNTEGLEEANWHADYVTAVVRTGDKIRSNRSYFLTVKVLNNDTNLGMAKVVLDWGGIGSLKSTGGSDLKGDRLMNPGSIEEGHLGE